jgi:predicted SAM-dependent methyltransferase
MGIKRSIIRAQPPAEAGGKLNLHLGCGRVDHKEFINIDGYPFPHVHYAQVIDKLPQFDDQSVDLIYASHCLEHFKYHDTHRVLSEWHRVLRKGAVLRISVPDFDRLLDIYHANNNDPDVILPQLMGGQNNKYNFHYTAFNELNLTRMLKAAGFREVRLWQPGSGPLTTFPDFSTYKKEVGGRLYEVSLNIEALK